MIGQDALAGQGQQTPPMRLLAIETSGRAGSIVAVEAGGGEIRAAREIQLPNHPRTAQTLAPAMRQLLQSAGWRPSSVDLVAVTVGPGSFTGLRIGVTAAKVFAYAVGAEIIGVNTLNAIAFPIPVRPGRLWAVLDAHRRELYAASYTAPNGVHWQMDRPTQVIGCQSFLALIKPGDLVAGPVLNRLSDHLAPGVDLVEPTYWTPTAKAVAQVAHKAYQGGHRDDVWRLVPEYYRLSAAEEKRRE